MAWTEQDLREIEDELKKGSQGVGDVPEAESLDGITSLPAYQEVEGQDMPRIVRAPLTLLAAPALDAADKANAAATKAEENANAAQTAANSANEKAGLAAQAASDANAAKEGAEAATQSANTAASNAEEKAAAANTAAQDAEKVANNPTYIGKDHYVYVYNKDTGSFDKTDIYCKGEPGSSFRVAGEYATLEALKSAVPDGSAVDGFMAVGTEAPYDYYAWVNGEWVSQGKIGGIDEAPTDGKAYGRKNGDWAEVPEHLNLTSENLNDINGAGFATQKSTADYTSPENNYPINENGALIFANANYGHSNQIYGSYLTNRWFARGGGNQQGVRTNWKEFAFTDDVLTKTNTSSFTPTGDYQPATKKYVDDSISTARSVGYMMQLTEIDASGLDEDTWYPVTISAGERMNIRVEVLVSLDSGTKPSWSTHERGFSTRKIWEFAPSVWGVNRDSNITIYLSDFSHADIDPVRGLGNLSQFDSCYVFVRGGGKYHFYASHNAYVILRTDTYKPSGGTQSVSPTSETPAEIVADIVKKKYVDNIAYGKVINADSGTISNDLIGNGLNLTGVDAEERVNRYFGNLSNFRSVVQDIIENHTRYFIHNSNDCIELGCLNTWKNTGNTEHELHFILTGFGDGNLHTKRYSIRITENTDDARFIIVNIISSDNLTTITKKTAAEYEAIGSKDANTAYCVTD